MAYVLAPPTPTVPTTGPSQSLSNTPHTHRRVILKVRNPDGSLYHPPPSQLCSEGSNPLPDDWHSRAPTKKATHHAHDHVQAHETASNSQTVSQQGPMQLVDNQVAAPS